VEELDQRLAAIETSCARILALLQGGGGPPPTGDLYTPAEAARLLRRSTWTIREWCRTGKVRALRTGFTRGKAHEWAIPAAEVEKLLAIGVVKENQGPTGADTLQDTKN
jgi:excisionase family DNA binding protein